MLAWNARSSFDTLRAMNEQRLRRASTTLSRALKRRRQELGLTQENVAERLGIVARQYQKIESGKVNVTLRTLVRLALALNMETRELL
ncbi:MAG: helix-turn-helix domain-containing protein [Vulcanimicrobiaceae bacterium]